MTRTPEEVFQHHAQALGAGDLEEIVADYADDAVVISPAGVKRGQDGVRETFTQLLADVPDAAWELKTQIYEGDVLFLEWAADTAATAPSGCRRSATPCSTRADPGPVTQPRPRRLAPSGNFLASPPVHLYMESDKRASQRLRGAFRQSGRAAGHRRSARSRHVPGGR
jgi:ketosteroid isomerase-like protein